SGWASPSSWDSPSSRSTTTSTASSPAEDLKPLRASRVGALALARPLLAACLVSFASPASALEPFTIRDIKVEGVQRTEAGTVFSYLPVKVGERIDDEKAAASIKALYATGFYSDVRLETDGDVL